MSARIYVWFYIRLDWIRGHFEQICDDKPLNLRKMDKIYSDISNTHDQDSNEINQFTFSLLMLFDLFGIVCHYWFVHSHSYYVPA